MSQRAWRTLIVVLCAVCACGAHGQATPPESPTPPASASGSQTPSQPVVPAPGEIYKQAMHPLEVVRASLDNWSDPEVAALAVGMHKANVACAKMKPDDFSGDALYDLAHLCAFGQDWNDANAAAVRYIGSRGEPHRAQAYAISINALMHQNATEPAAQTTLEMLQWLPYDAEVAFTLRYVKDALEQAGNPAALELAGDEHEKIVAALKLGVPLKAGNGDAVMDIGTLYDSAMRLAFFEQYNNNQSAAAAIAASCDNALPDTATLPPEERQHIENVRTRFHLLGEQLPNLTVMRALISPTAKPLLPQSFGAGTVFVLFPDWCVQCRHMMKTLTEFAKVNATTPLHAYGLVFADTSMIADNAVHDAYLKELQGTSSLVVPAETAQTFGAQDFPLAIAVDGTGTIRFIGTIPPTAFNGDGYIEKVIQRMAASGPVKKTSSVQMHYQ